MKISIVSPIYKSPEIIEIFISRVEKTIQELTTDYEIILVVDGCPLNSWEVIEKACSKNIKIKGVNLSRNFGQHYAITAGLQHATGDWIVVMDGDLQDQPEEIPKLLAQTKNNYDIILAARFKRQDSTIKKLFSYLFYKTLNWLTGANFSYNVANFGVYSNKVISTLNQFNEPIPYFPGLIQWVGFKKITVDVQHAAREFGKSSYNFKRLLNLAVDIILAYSDKPLKLITKLGVFISILSILSAFIYFYQWYTGKITIPGYTSLIISIWFLSGIILSTLGIVGLYLGKVFEGVKNRPLYIINEKINL